MHTRLEQLTQEFNSGLSELKTIDHRRAQLRDQLLRISGAIAVLREITEEQPLDNEDFLRAPESVAHDTADAA